MADDYTSPLPPYTIGPRVVRYAGQPGIGAYPLRRSEYVTVSSPIFARSPGLWRGAGVALAQ